MVDRFVLVVAARPIEGELITSLEHNACAGDGDMAVRRVTWADTTGHVHYWGWEYDEPASVITPAGLTATTGTPRLRRRAHTGSGIADRLDLLAQAYRDNPDNICDAFSLVRIAADGRGFVARDPLGVHPLYIARTGSATIVGNRVGLVADVLARLAKRPARRDSEAAAWLAFCGFVMDGSTGYSGVRTVPQDCVLRLEAGRLREEALDPVWMATPHEGPVDVEAAADQIEADIADALGDVAADSTRRPRLELTGGKDSRAILAVAVRAGLIDAFDLVTFGRADLPDMRVARELAAAQFVQ